MLMIIMMNQLMGKNSAEMNRDQEYLLNTITRLSNVLSIVPGARLDFHNLYGTFFTPRLHVKYNIDENTTIRASAGKGFRSVNLFAENLNYLASSRDFVIINNPTYEEAWNYGLNLTRYIPIKDRDLRIIC